MTQEIADSPVAQLKVVARSIIDYHTQIRLGSQIQHSHKILRQHTVDLSVKAVMSVPSHCCKQSQLPWYVELIKKFL